MANFSQFGLPFSERPYADGLQAVRDARKLRRMRLPEKVREAPKEKSKTMTKDKKIKAVKAFESLPKEVQKALLAAQLEKMEGES